MGRGREGWRKGRLRSSEDEFEGEGERDGERDVEWWKSRIAG
jgi:hypothetical protein